MSQMTVRVLDVSSTQDAKMMSKWFYMLSKVEDTPDQEGSSTMGFEWQD
jgi:hypothetical protein